MVASVLKRGDVAIVSYATDPIGADGDDIIRFVLLAPIGSGTQIFFSDRNWNGTAFPAAGGGDGTFTYTAGANLAAGTVITISSTDLFNAGMDLSNNGDTVYVYQGTDANTPTTFLSAIDFGDGNTTFNGNLTGTGLTAGIDAVAVAHDQASFAGQSTQIPQTQLAAISNNVQWHGHSGDDIGGTIYDDRLDSSFNGPLHNADMQLFVVNNGGGQSDAIVRIDNDEAANVASHLVRLFRDNPNFTRLEDITFDIEDGVWFAADNEGTDVTRILKGNIADLVSGTSNPTITVVFDYVNNGADPNDDKFIQGIEIDTVNNRIFFGLGDILFGHEFRSIDYNGGSSRNWGLIDLVIDPNFGFAGGIEDLVVDTTNNTAYFSYVLVDAGAGQVLQNYVVKLTAPLNAAAPNPAVENYAIVNIANAGAPPAGYPAGRIPDAEGSIRGMDYHAGTNTLWFVTGRLGAGGTGGIFTLNLNTNVYTEVWQQPSNNAHNTPQTFPTTLLVDIEVDSIGNRYYVTSLNSTDTPVGHDGTATDENGSRIWSGSLTAAIGTAPTFFASLFENTANGAGAGMEIDYAPTLALGSAGSTYTESTNLPASPAGPTVDVATSPIVNDVDQAIIQGATAAITTNFVAGDQLTFTNSGGITGSYNAATGVVTFTGNASFAAYQTVLDSVRFTNAGDNPTNYGASTSRTISFTVFDGLINSDPATATLTVVGINDAPVNANAGADSGAEDTTFTIAGVTVFDVDANPATQDIIVTLSVTRGTLTVATGVTNGLSAGEISNNGTASVILTGTQNQINATLANATGLQFTGGTDVNGTVTLTMATNDQGFNGNDPGISGTGTSEADSDQYTVTVTAVNDAPTVVNGTSQAAAVILEDKPKDVTGPTAPPQTVADLFGGHFSDALDDQTAFPAGSSPNTLAGVAITSNGSSVGTGQWQYHNGSAWVDIGTSVTTLSAKLLTATTPIRFNPDLNYNSAAAPTLAGVLVDNSGTAFTNASPNVNVTGAGGTTPYSIGTVTITQAITPVNDAPTVANLNADVATWQEHQSPTLLDSGTGNILADVDSPNFNTGTLTVSIGAGLVAAQDQLLIRTTSGISTTGPAVFYNPGGGPVQIGTFTGGGAGGGDLFITFDADATLVAVQSLIRAIGYDNSGGDNPTAGSRTINWTLVDGGGTDNGGADTRLVTSSVNVVAVDDSPVVVSTNATKTFTEGVNGAAAAIVVDNAVTVSDVDHTTFGSVQVIISAGYVNGHDVLAFVNDNATAYGNISASYDTSIGYLTLTSAGATATQSQFQAALRAVTYDNLSQEPSTGDRTLQIRALNGTFAASGGNFTLQVVAQNDSPTGTSTTISSPEDAVLTLTAGHLGFSDVDADTLSGVKFGQAPTGGTLFYDGDGVGVGSPAAAITTFGTGTVYDVAGGKLTFVPTAHLNGNGAASINFAVVDNGGVAGNGQNTDISPETLTINLTSVNDAPAGADNGATVPVAGTHTFSVANFATGMTDPDDSPANAFAGVKITTLPAPGAGTIFYDADGGGVNPPVAIAAGDSFTAQNLIDGKLTYVPSAGTGGTMPSFTFQVRDDGGIVGGGVDTDQSPNTFTFTVAAPQASPAINDLAGDTSTFVEGGSAVLLDDSGAPELAATVTDTDSADFNGGTLTVSTTGNEVAGEDVLGISTGGTVTLSSGTSVGSVVSVGGQAIGTISANGTGGNDLVVALNTANATPATVSILVQALTYSNTNTANPSTSQRTIAVTVSDGDGSSDSENVLVNVSGTNDDPTVSGIQGDVVTYTEGGLTNSALMDVGADAAILDADSANFEGGSLTVRVTTNKVATEDQLFFYAGGTSPLTFSGNELFVNGVSVGNFSPAGAGVDRVFTLNAGATPERISLLLQNLGYHNANFGNPSTAQRTIEFVLTDGDGGTVTFTSLVNVTATPDAPIAKPDAVSTPEDVVGTGSLFADNGSGVDSDADGDAITISAVSGGTVGTPFALASGAILTVNANGTYSYNPNGKFNSLTDGSSGASNTSTVGDTFQYTLAGGNSVTVTVTVTGVAGPGDRLQGTSGNDIITGSPNGEFFWVQQGGDDDLSGENGDDVFLFGASMTSADKVDGGEGHDQIVLQGNYSPAPLTFGTDVLRIESLVLLPGDEAAFGDQGGLFDYNIVMLDGNVEAGTRFVIDANRLRAGEDFTFDGSDEQDAYFYIYGGDGTDILTGGDGDDVFLYGFFQGSDSNYNPATDRVIGGDGHDQMALRGNYTVTLGPNAMSQVESLVLLSGRDVRADVDYQYDVTTVDANVGVDVELVVDGGQLRSGETLTFDGGLESTGFFRIYGGDGQDDLTGGQKNDTIRGQEGNDLLYGGLGADTLIGGEGTDTFKYGSALESTSALRDTIDDFTTGDVIDLSAIDAMTGAGSANDSFIFIGADPFTGAAGEVRAYETSPGQWFVEANMTSGDTVAELVIAVTTTDGQPLDATDFLL